MKKQITSTDPFVFSLRAKLLRFAARLATHGALWLIPVLLFTGVLPHPGSRSETLAAAFLSACILILIRALGAQLLSLAEKLKFVQKLMEADDPRAAAIFETIGAYLAYTTVLYSQFYDLDYMMLLGRVMSGKGGDTILRVCNEILADEFPALAAKCAVTLPDEKMRRVGQSVAAASLPATK